MIIVERQGIVLGDIEDDIRRLESLLTHLKHLANGKFPSSKDLDAAPVIDDFRLALRPAPCIDGRFIGHPELRGRRSVTSEVWVLALESGWVRTYSRLYRLGRRYGIHHPTH
jgi:hypothetical protein